MGHEWAIGIDAGGTTTRLVVLDAATGAPVARAQGASREDGGPALSGPLAKALFEGGASANAVRAVCAGVAKISRAEVKARWEAELPQAFPEARIALVPDFVIAFHGATGGVGIAVLAGTGSVVYGEDARGNAARVGGRGWEYGDEGSGAWLTTEIVRRTLRALDRMSPGTPLTEAVCAYLGTQDPSALAERARWHAQTQGRGFLIPMALQKARSGDREAENLFVGAAGWLGLQAKAVAARLDFPEQDGVALATVGGLWDVGDFLLRPFRQVVHRWLPHARIIPARASPVQGAAHRACSLLP